LCVCVSCASLWLKKLETGGRRNFGAVTRGCEPPGLRVDAKHDHVVRTLVRDEQEPSRRIDREVSWPFSFGRNVLDEIETSRSRVDREDHDAVVTAIRSVKKAA